MGEDGQKVFGEEKEFIGESRNRLTRSIIDSLSLGFDSVFLSNLETNTVSTIKQSQTGNALFTSDLSVEDNIRVLIPVYTAAYGAHAGSCFYLEYFKKELFRKGDSQVLEFKNGEKNLWMRLEHHAVERDSNRMVTKVLTMVSLIDDLKVQKLEDDIMIARQKMAIKEKQAELLETAKRVNEAHRVRAEFVSRISHEIRTPMNAIVGMNEVILNETKDEIIKGYAQDAYRASIELLGTINEILDFSRIEMERVELINDDYNLGRFIGNIYSLFSLRADDKNLKFICDIDDNLPKIVYGDEIHLRQVIVNLLNNAIKCTEIGSITFRATCFSKSKYSVRIKYEISDTGRGIRPEDLERLYKEIENGGQNKDVEVRGRDLVLSVTEELLNLMKSKLEVRSEYGKGSSFSFIVEQRITDSANIDSYKSAIYSMEEECDKEYFNENVKVLVVDDNKVNLKVFKALLRKTQISVDSAISGIDALEMMKNKKYDLIFLDHYMPQMDGFEVLKQMKKDENSLNFNTTTIVLTANAIKGAKDEYGEAGFDDVVFKPITQTDLIEVLIRHLKE